MVKHSSRIELRKSAYKSNINFIKKKIGKNVIFSSVIKANAYGHGIDVFVPMAESCGVDHFSVASAYEAWEVLQVCNPDSHIMIMGILYEDDIPWAIENNIEFYVYNYDRLSVTLAAAKKVGKPAKIHIEVETGANRTGMPKEEFSKSLTFLKNNADFLVFEGLCTHLGGAESFANNFKIEKQLKNFKTFLTKCKQKKVMPHLRHVASSAAALSIKESLYDMVRVGVAQYGFWPSPDIYYTHINQVGKNKDGALKRIITWKTDIMDTRKVNEGEFIGYGTAFQAVRKMNIAVIPLGYCNGYPRGLSNRGYVLIQGKKAPIVGLINMNLFMVDITHIPKAKVGDEVVLIGRQNNNVIHISSFTNFTNLLNNEMLSRLPASIPRKVVR
ncbi:alanine racemase [Echinicola jeungdonensis]|uniref:Alanine racemase n=1 Tax=Echinicola jeungdonensis TaxID=709343 RepID=A0ABV5J395_9BACT|nr:alanine racemase [Echinicola jeungdonensis]MDN3670707.1 alanine racemase [Echinicola jeungdonensis]